MADLAAIRSDLAAEQGDLDRIVERLDEPGWDVPTPAVPWTVRDQISHLAFFDEAATLAVSHPDRFAAGLKDAATDVEGYVNRPLERGRALTGSDVLEWWRAARGAMHAVFTELDPRTRVPWFGPPMSPASFVTARLMETWAHGQDVVDALGIDRQPTDRLRHVAHLGVRARPFSYSAHGLPAPEEPVRVELTAPSGEVWSWEEDTARDRVTGDALDFCLVVTQRRHIDDTDLVVEGGGAAEWMAIAQAFAGPPGEGRKPGQFLRRTP